MCIYIICVYIIYIDIHIKSAQMLTFLHRSLPLRAWNHVGSTHQRFADVRVLSRQGLIKGGTTQGGMPHSWDVKKWGSIAMGIAQD